MKPKHRPPSRQRYEAAHPTLTARVPAAVKARLQAALAAEGLTFSEWIQAQVAGHVGEVAAAYNAGRAVGTAAGDAAGYRRGYADGAAWAAAVGFRAGLTVATWAHARGRTYHVPTLWDRLRADPAAPDVVAGLIPSEYQPLWRQLLRASPPLRSHPATPASNRARTSGEPAPAE